MRVHQWQGPGRRITASEDRFYSSELCESTLFRFSTDYLEVEPHVGAFSLKLVLSGEEQYFFGRRTVTLSPGRFLLVNNGDSYSSRINSPTDSLSIFYRDDEISIASSSIFNSDKYLLDNGPSTDTRREVARISNQITPIIRHRILAMIASLDRIDREAIAEQAMFLLLDTLQNHWQIVPPTALMEIRRRSTRDELVLRVLRARNVIDDLHGMNVTLDLLAETACLSRYHFLRIFRDVVGESPIVYARQQKLKYGAGLIRQGECPKSVAKSLGYKTVRNFVRAQKRTFGRANRCDSTVRKM